MSAYLKLLEENDALKKQLADRDARIAELETIDLAWDSWRGSLLSGIPLTDCAELLERVKRLRDDAMKS